jgi:hypothetical protein
LARGRLAVLDELDPERPRRDLGPYFGFTGEAVAGDPRRGLLYVTALEGIARCPWQAFLARALRIEAPPDPLEALPGADARLLGSVVHAVLEGVVVDAGAGCRDDLAGAAARSPVAVDWPAPDALRRRALAAAEQVLREEGIALGGLARVLADQALPYLEAARERAFAPSGEATVLAAEVHGRWERGGGARAIGFRADRVDAVDDGLLLTDYKTGRPISGGKTDDTRRRHLVAAVARGASLQASVYARAAGAGGRGRFLFLGPDVPPDAAEYTVGAGDEEIDAAFAASLAAVEAGWQAGALFPRLVEGDLHTENAACRSCMLTTACLRGDSGARQRLVRWVQEPGGSGGAEAAFRALWQLFPVPGGAR